MTAYLYRAAPQEQLRAYRPEEHGYPCEYVGGDEGPPVVAGEYLLVRDLGAYAVFLQEPTGAHYAAVRIGEPTLSPVGDDWRQGQAHIMLGTSALVTTHLEGVVGPFSFYDLLFALERGDVTSREAVVAGSFGEAVWSLRGHVRPLPCATVDEALALLALFTEGRR